MPQVVEAEDVEAVIDELCDADRRLPVVLASTPHDVDFDAWLEGTVDPLVRPLVGLAILYVLTPGAESVFNRALEHHRVYNGGIRTYLPGVDPAWPADGQRHRVMSKRLITENPRLAARILNQLPQGIATRLPLPDALDSVPLMRTRARDGVGGSEQERLRDENDALHEILEEAAREQRVRADEIRDLKRELRQAEGNEHVISPRKVVRDESKSVKANGDWSRARTFPVPRHVHPDGKLFMGAHLRIGGGNTIAPRLHYYDGACTDHGIFVGYMGPHLTNTMT